jgi:hypothetical protein
MHTPSIWDLLGYASNSSFNRLTRPVEPTLTNDLISSSSWSLSLQSGPWGLVLRLCSRGRAQELGASQRCDRTPVCCSLCGLSDGWTVGRWVCGFVPAFGKYVALRWNCVAAFKFNRIVVEIFYQECSPNYFIAVAHYFSEIWFSNFLW